MRAVLYDREPPGWTRFPPLVLLLAPFAFAPFEGVTALTYATVLLGAALPGVLPRLGPTSARIEPGGGVLRVHTGGLRSQVISAKDVVGASTARVSGGIALTLARQSRRTPTTLVFATEAELDRAREALGIGHGGFGEVRWPLVPGAAHTWAPTTRAVAAVFATLAFALEVAALLSGSSGWTALAVMFLTLATPLAFFGALGSLSRWTRQFVELGPRGVLLGGFRETAVPYSAVSGVSARNGVFELGVGDQVFRAGHRVGALAGPGVDAHELEILSAQLAACVARAGGLGPRKQEARTRVDTLRRGAESARDWLARVDVAASMMTQVGYRGGTIEKDDLWLTLTDPEAPEDLRAAAGRILTRVEGDPAVRTRVSDVVAAVREEDAQRRMRVAIFPELDPSGDALAELEQAEAAPRRMAR